MQQNKLKNLPKVFTQGWQITVFGNKFAGFQSLKLKNQQRYISYIQLDTRN